MQRARLLMRNLAFLLALQMVSYLAFIAAAQPARSIKVAASPAVRGVFAALVPDFQAQNAVHVETTYDVFAAIERRIKDGEHYDVVVLSPEAIQSLVVARELSPETVRLGRVRASA